MNNVFLPILLDLISLYWSKASNDSLKHLLAEYVKHHFGEKYVQSALDYYEERCAFYKAEESLDIHTRCREIADGAKNKMTYKDRVLFFLRFVELSATDSGIQNDEYKAVAEIFEISGELCDDILAFVSKTGESQGVRTLPYGKGQIRLLHLKDYDTLLFSYRGESLVKYNDAPVLNESFMVWDRSGVLKCAEENPLYYYNGMTPFKADKKDRPQLKLRGNEIDFRYGNGPGGIHNFTFNLYGGELVAIMGGSGTGKTTLLYLLNGTLHPQKGRITINGHSIDEAEAKSLIGFVPQDDLLIEDLTVYQNLYYTAQLCFQGMSEEELNDKVLALLHDLGLIAAKDLKAGSPVNKFISGGQRKRLNIALELIREPDILFLDEPTSGLSSSDSKAVMNLLREQAYRGKLIITNIHQPSSEIFKMFDRLWLFDVGGYPIFDGNPVEAVTYFKQAAGYGDSTISVCPSCGNIDSETILSIIDEKIIDDKGQITDTRKKTPQEWHELYLKSAAKNKEKVEDLPGTDQKRPSVLKQMWIFLKRNCKAKLTDRQWLLITLLEAPLLALICALLTHYAPEDGYTIMNNQNLVSYFFMAIIVATFLGMSGSAEEIIKDRALLKREKFLGLSYKSYIWSKILFMAGVSLVQTLLFLLVGNGVMGISCLFWEWWLILFVTALLSSLIGLLLSQWLRSVVAIYITIPLLLIPQILLCGLVVEFTDLAPKSHTANVPVIGDVIPSRWAFEALAVTSFSDNDYERAFFDADKEKYEARYYESAYLHELRSQLETMKDKRQKGEPTDKYLDVIRKSLPLLLDVTGMEAYGGDYSYDELSKVLDDAKSVLMKRSRKATSLNDKRMDAIIAEIGKNEIIRIKKDNYNLQLEKYVVNADAEQMYKVVDGYIVPSAGFIYLDPVTHNGRAPFYSSTKIVGDWRVKTLWFNVLVLLLMCGICTVSLLNNVPGRFFNNK